MSSSTSNESTAEAAARNKRTLWLILAVCAAPFILGTLAFYFFPASGRTNYGELLPPAQMEMPLRPIEGEALSLSALRGKWVMLAIDDSVCDEACQLKLYYMRQVRTAQGKERERVRMVWLLRDGGQPSTALREAHPDLLIAHAPQELMLPAVEGDARRHIYLIDPLGNLMLRFPADPEPKKVIKDLSRLLRVSRVG